MPFIRTSAKQGGDPGLENVPDALRIPDVVLNILAHIDAPTLLSLCLTNSSINAIIATHQRTICKSIFWRDFSIELDLCPPALRYSSRHWYLRTIVRAHKTYALAVDAIKYRDPAYYHLVANCTRGILIIWSLNDIEEHVYPSHRLPTCIQISRQHSVFDTWPRLHRRVAGLYRFLGGKLRILSASAAVFTAKPDNSFTVSEVTLAQRTIIKKEGLRSKVRFAQYQYLKALDRITRIEFEPAKRTWERIWNWDVVVTALAGQGLVQETQTRDVEPFEFERQRESRHESNAIIRITCRFRSRAITKGANERLGPGWAYRPTRRLPWLLRFP